MKKPKTYPTKTCEDMPGDVYMVPDEHWKITTNRTDHPGVCITCNQEQREVVLCKGTSAKNVIPKYQDCYTIVEPREANGLTGLTAFYHYPQIVRLHKVSLYYPERHIGTLAQDDFNNLLYDIGIAQAMKQAIDKKYSD